jgi:hypothetical protein
MTWEAFMMRRSLIDLQDLIWAGRYSIKPHAARHAISEGFTEADIVATLEHGREIAVYPEDSRMLILGYICVSTIKIPLHVVVDYSLYRWLDVVTAFIPENPYRVISRERVAILVSKDREEAREHLIDPTKRSKHHRPRAARAWKGRHA